MNTSGKTRVYLSLYTAIKTNSFSLKSYKCVRFQKRESLVGAGWGVRQRTFNQNSARLQSCGRGRAKSTLLLEEHFNRKSLNILDINYWRQPTDPMFFFFLEHSGSLKELMELVSFDVSRSVLYQTVISSSACRSLNWAVLPGFHDDLWLIFILLLEHFIVF